MYGFLPSPLGWTSRRMTYLRTYNSSKDELCISLLVRYISDSTRDCLAQPWQSIGQAMTE